VSDEIDATTEPLPNGAALPEHPGQSTAYKIVSYGNVYDAEDGLPLSAGKLHESMIRMLMGNETGGLGHLYLFAIRDCKIFHTRRKVVIDCKCVEVADA